MKTNSFGKIVHSCWFDLVNHYGNIELDEFVVMPNHVHGIIGIFESVAVGAGLRPAPTGKKNDPLSEIIRAFKSFSARQNNEIRKTAGKPIWQRNYFDHIIRDERSLEGIRDYISTNPQRWEDDKENPDKSGNDPFESWLLAQGKIRIKS
ncbi:MAG: hypothetical protein HW374_2039 [Bacteroidetes bacterium]|nr:hypothetical protein [Bacteroidota bacterium]